MAKSNINVGSYTRRTKSGKIVRVNAYNQSRDAGAALNALLKSDSSRPSNNAQTGQFAGGSSVPRTDAVSAAQSRARKAAAKKVAPKAAAKKSAPPKKGKQDSPEAFERTSAPKAEATRAAAVETQASKVSGALPGGDKQSAPKQQSRPAPTPLRGIPRGSYTADTMSEDEQRVREAAIIERADRVLAAGDTQQRHSTAIKSDVAGVGVVYTPERAAIHKEIISEMVAEAKRRGVPREGKAIVSGGLPGAGKSYVLGNRLGIDMDKYVVLNPDEFKERLIEKTSVPGTEDGQFGPMEMATVVHEESSDLTKMARDVFESSGYNIILDVTLGGHGEKAKGKHRKTIEGLRARGYTVDGVFVDIPHEMSKVSAKNRYLNGWARWMNGEDSMGGRYVPEGVAAKDVSTQGFNSSNRDNFEHVKDLFFDYKTVDNSVRDDGAPLRVVEEGGNKHDVTPDDPFVTNSFDPFDDPIARLEDLLARLRSQRS